jgi:hypothetical protein
VTWTRVLWSLRLHKAYDKQTTLRYVTLQPKGLGHSVPEILDEIKQLQAADASISVYEKSTFSMCTEEVMLKLMSLTSDSGRPDVYLFGLESHVCIL